MYKYGRTDFIETNLKPALVEGHQHHMSFIETARADFERHLRRLLVVRQEKQKTWLDLIGMCVFSVIYSKQATPGLTHQWFRELSFSRLECGVVSS